MGVKELSQANSELFDFCRRNDLEKLRGWITLKRNKRPRTPLNFLRPNTPNAAWLSTIKDPSSYYTALHYAALQGSEDACRLLLDADPLLSTAKDKRGCIPLHLAAWYGHSNVVKVLLEYDKRSVDIANNAHESALHLSAQQGHAKTVQILLDNSADPRLQNARCETPLDIAARTGHAAVCKILVTVCPDLALQSAVECSSTAENGRSAPQVVYPMHAAARHSHIACMQMLRHSGFDLNYVTDEGSALHVAAVFGQVEAVKYLIEEGIDPHIKDARGRTVLEMLEEHETQKASDLTQVIQSRVGWGECRKLIEEYISSHGTLNSSSDSGIDHPEGDRSPRDVVWRPLPGNSNIVSYGTSSTAASTSSNGSTTGVYYPPSMNAEMAHLNDDLASTISISTRDDCDLTSQASPSQSSLIYGSRPDINRTWNTRAIDGRVPRFPITSPNTKARHNSSKRVSDTLPTKMSTLRTTTATARGSILPGDQCVYRAPPGLEAKRLQVDGSTHTYNPALAYDNIPSQRTWDHSCQNPHEYLKIPRAIREIPFSKNRNDGTQTLPTSRLRTRAPLGNAFTIIKEDTPGSMKGNSQEREVSIGSTQSLNRRPSKEHEGRARTGSIQSTESGDRHPPLPATKPPCPRNPSRWSRVSDREESLGMSHCLDTREGSRASTVTFACSTLERSHSPPSRYASGRAPLALPEELTGSTSTSIMSSSVSPERTLKETDNDTSFADESSLTIHPSDTTTKSIPSNRFVRDTTSGDTADVSSIRSSLHPDDNLDPPSPNTSQTKIFDTLCGQETLQRLGRGESPLTPGTECSDSTVASSCSLPIISQISSTPPSVASPRKESMHKQMSVDESVCSAIEVKMRPNQDGIPPSGKLQPRRTMTGRSLNESAEWNKINEIMGTFGGAVCRESVFASEYEPQVAVYLRDRRSRALTIQKRESSQTPEKREEPQRDYDSPSKTLGIGDWLNVAVGIPNPKAKEVGAILERFGFDRCTQLNGSLDRTSMSLMNIDKSMQYQIFNYLDTLDPPKTNANNYNYVSDWLSALELQDYLSNFFEANFRSMLIVRSAEMDSTKLHQMGITLLGHVRRILNSLMEAFEEERKRTMERKATLTKQLQTERSATNSPAPSDIARTGSSANLMNSAAAYSAHYLGSREISNIDGTEESRRAMNKLKRGIREIAKVPHVQLEISVEGVKVLDANTKNVMASHEIYNIQIVCQDERDLNCFAYISQEGERNFAHVFCVLTADVATEIIMTFGRAFKLAYKIQTGEIPSEEIAHI